MFGEPGEEEGAGDDESEGGEDAGGGGEDFAEGKAGKGGKDGADGDVSGAEVFGVGFGVEVGAVGDGAVAEEFAEGFELEAGGGGFVGSGGFGGLCSEEFEVAGHDAGVVFEAFACDEVGEGFEDGDEGSVVGAVFEDAYLGFPNDGPNSGAGGDFGVNEVFLVLFDEGGDLGFGGGLWFLGVAGDEEDEF